MEGELDALVAEAKAKIGELIAKPKMTEKLLSKPPFRFLHDIISALTGTTGFAEGLYSGEELDSASITDKNAKIVYLEKIFTLVGICMVRRARTLDGFLPSLSLFFFSRRGLLRRAARGNDFASPFLLTSSRFPLRSRFFASPNFFSSCIVCFSLVAVWLGGSVGSEGAEGSARLGTGAHKPIPCCVGG